MRSRYERAVGVRLTALGLLVSLVQGCGSGDEKKAGGGGGETAEEVACQSTREYFAREVWAPVMGQICIDCHAPGGIAPASGSSFELMPPGYPGFLEENFKALQELGRTKYDGSALFLLKPLGQLDHGGGRVLEEGSVEHDALVELAERLDAVESCPPGPAPALSGVQLLGPSATLRKAAIALVGRLPTPEETQAVVDGGEAGLPAALDALMAEAAFVERVKEIWNDVLLTDRFLSYNGHALNALDDADFPLAGDYYDALPDEVKATVNRSVAREPLDLIGHVVQNDRPFTEILTAPYTVLNDATSAVYNAGVPPADYVGQSALREGKIISRHDGATIEWPHAGVLTSPMVLARFPTTPTNRNRHRARKIFEIFLATNILKIAERPIDSQESAKYINPTRDDPTCNQCHRQMDPVAGAFLRFGDYSQTSYQPEHEWHSEMFPPGFRGETMPVAEFDRGPQWLGERLARDPRFPRSVVYTLFQALVGQPPLDYPQDPAAPDHAARLDAWGAQEATLNAMAIDLAAAGFNLKSAVRALLLSAYFRASGSSPDASPEQLARLADTGTARLSTPEVLSRKIEAVSGIPWSRDWDRSAWLATDYRILYGGIDSDIVVSRLTTPNGLMAAVQERMASEVACAATAWDFLQPAESRFLFRHVSASDTFASNPDGVRQNVQYLHARILGEDLSLDAPELERTVQLFSQTVDEGAGKLESGELERGLPWACRGRRNPLTGEDLPEDQRLNDDETYAIRAWMAVVTYLLSDYRFLYE